LTVRRISLPSLYVGALDAYLEELYVIAERRECGLGRALLEAAMQRRPAVISPLAGAVARSRAGIGSSRVRGMRRG
jgi:GNAT superfamily N-acetyltransferase